MRPFTFKELETSDWLATSYATGVHSNPKFYKYYWWVFWRDSPCEGSKFLSKKYRMSTKEAHELMAKLHEQQEKYFVTNSRYPRYDPVVMPFDPNSKRWKKAIWALPFDEDTDEEYQGHK
jgi:hypothetical protein